MTNYEKIKAMSVEEMADVLYDALKEKACNMRSEQECKVARTCTDCIVALLLQEAEE